MPRAPARSTPYVFAVLRRSRRVARRRRRPRRARHHVAVPRPGASSSPTCSPAATSSSSPPPARARRSPSASPMVDRLEANGPAPGARPRAHPRARLADRRGGPRRWPTPARSRSPPSTAAPASRSRRDAARKAHILVATPGRLEDLIAPRRRHARAASGSSSSTRPTACSTWASARPSTASSAATPRDRQTLFFSATLDGEAGRIAARYTHDARHARAGRLGRAARRRRAPLRAASPTRTSSTPSSRELRRDDRGRTLVFVRTKRGADRLVKRLRAHGVERRRHARQQDPGPAREGAAPLPARARSTRSSPPTSPPAASTSTTSRT